MKIKLDGTVLELKDGQYISEDGEVVLSLDEAEQSILDGKVEILAEESVEEVDDNADDEEDSEDEKESDESDDSEEDGDSDEEEDKETTNETVELSFDDINITKDINEMFGETDFSDEFKTKAGVIYEAAVTSTIRTHVKKLEEQYNAKVEAVKADHEEKLKKEVSEGLNSITTDLNSYLDYIAEEWMTENKLAVEAGVKTEITESFIDGLKTLFTEAYVEVPEEKRDLVAEQAAKIEELEGKLNEEMNRKIEMKGQLREANRKSVFDQVSSDLTDTEKARLETLSADLTYETNEDYKAKLNVLVEKYFNDVDGSEESDTPAVEPELSETEKDKSYDDTISAYISAISKGSK